MDHELCLKLPTPYDDRLIVTQKKTFFNNIQNNTINNVCTVTNEIMAFYGNFFSSDTRQEAVEMRNAFPANPSPVDIAPLA
jgi:hypothetical protein